MSHVLGWRWHDEPIVVLMYFKDMNANLGSSESVSKLNVTYPKEMHVMYDVSQRYECVENCESRNLKFGIRNLEYETQNL